MCCVRQHSTTQIKCSVSMLTVEINVNKYFRTNEFYGIETTMEHRLRSVNSAGVPNQPRASRLKHLTPPAQVQSNHQLRMDVYTFPELADMVMCYGESRRNGRRALHIYQQQFQNRNHPHHTMFARLYQRLRYDRSLRRRCIGGRPRRHPFSIDDYTELKGKARPDRSAVLDWVKIGAPAARVTCKRPKANVKTGKLKVSENEKNEDKSENENRNICEDEKNKDKSENEMNRNKCENEKNEDTSEKEKNRNRSENEKNEDKSENEKNRNKLEGEKNKEKSEKEKNRNKSENEKNEDESENEKNRNKCENEKNEDKSENEKNKNKCEDEKNEDESENEKNRNKCENEKNEDKFKTRRIETNVKMRRMKTN
ncbi:hypothetical protein ANN_17245 [Periplaneta americana]|uniref:DUF4817 domain-containing protein n=1 Tax=Periplaneta americana TaxID=6978 RepID=A0ABQ8SSF0_PERAM|nr:hypothetical protein ANN_17245 [Periplaneta americana]